MPRDVAHLHYPIQAGACRLSRWQGSPERCRWCDELVVGDLPWCSNLCEDDYRRNHWWDLARYAALTRDGERCVRCGLGPTTVAEARLLLRGLIPMSAVRAAELWSSPRWAQFALACSVEVNHIDPRRGRGYHSGCGHHLQNLETLCHRHHVEITASQRRAAG